ncbi:MAG: M20/M25/M40 family metallo-hydrolase [Cyclobacteriaceae bacterium]
MNYIKLLFAIGCATLSMNLIGQPEKLERIASEYAQKSWGQFFELLSLPNDAHNPADIEQNMQWCEAAFSERGFKTQRLTTQRLPLLLAQRSSKKADKTVLIYLQLDGQPVDSSFWNQDSPWKPALKTKQTDGSWREIDSQILEQEYDPEWRIFARSTSDAKGPVAMFLAALDAAKAHKIEPNYNIKIIMDFEEELGSPPLPAAVLKYQEELSADMLIIFDGPRHISNEPTLTFGARGIATITLTVFGPRKAQHSGHYGNYAPNPAWKLSHLLSTMKDEMGRVVIPGFYDGISLSEEVREILSRVPDDEQMIQKSIGIAAIDQVGHNYQEAIQYPSLNVRGMSAGWVGDKARTIIPENATAEIDVRLVLENDPERQISLIRKHIEQQGYYITQGSPTESDRMKYPKIVSFDYEVSYKAYRTDFDAEVGVWLTKALESAFGKTPIRIRTSGGSIPISPFVNTLGIPAVTVPTVNRDNNQHSPNENIRLGNYVDGIRTFLAILAEEL